MFSKPFLQMLGRRLSLILSNLIIVIVTIPFFFVLNFYVLSACRFVLGFMSALQVNGCSAIIGETVPTEYQGTMGTAINTGIVMAIFISNAFNLLLPYNDPTGSKDDFLWRISYSLQLVGVLITTPLWLFVFKNEPLRYLIPQAELDGTDSRAYT